MVTIKGHVQGVGFRSFVHRTATTLGISGEVWNAPDGSVKVHAQHQDEPHLVAFVRLLHDGPGEVSSIEMDPSSPVDASVFVIGAGR